MRLMHTKLPEFIKKIKMAARKSNKSCVVKGFENLETAKLQSLRTGRIEMAVEQLAQMESVDKIEMYVISRVPESMHSIIIKGINLDGESEYAILEDMNILNQTEDTLIHDSKIVDDRRATIGNH